LLPSFTLRVWVWISSQNLYNTHPVRVNAFSAVSRSFQSRFLGVTSIRTNRSPALRDLCASVVKSFWDTIFSLRFPRGLRPQIQLLGAREDLL
jgi:hypothetical protein